MNMSRIEDAINSLRRAASLLYDLGRYDEAKHFEWIADEASKDFRKLSVEMPRLRDLKSAADRAYDAYVTRPD